MVLDFYRGVHQLPSSNSIYILEKHKVIEQAERDQVTILGVFDFLETALHALDVAIKFRAHDMEPEDYYVVARGFKNSLELREKKTILLKWICTKSDDHGIYFGDIQLCDGLRTHAIE